MPELPEVEAVRREVTPWLNGRSIVGVALVDAPPGPKYANLELAIGGRVESIQRRGKFIVCPLSNGHELIIHLGMTGVLMKSEPTGHCRVRLDLEGGETVYFRDVRRFGRFCVAVHGDRSLLPTLLHMGPEPLSKSFTLKVFLVGLRSNTAIKTRLLSQRPVAGVGNIYADEALWRAGVRPSRPAKKVGRATADLLRKAIIEVLSEAVALGGTTIKDFATGEGATGQYGQNLKVYGRGGLPCARCGRPLSQGVLGQRSTVWCDNCQR